MIYGPESQRNLGMDLLKQDSSFRLEKQRIRRYQRIGKAEFGAGQTVLSILMGPALLKDAGRLVTLAIATAF